MSTVSVGSPKELFHMKLQGIRPILFKKFTTKGIFNGSKYQEYAQCEYAYPMMVETNISTW